MKLSKQHQLYLGILAVAGVGFLADRTVLRPSEAVAGLSEEYLVSDTDDKNAPESTPASITNTSFARTLQSFGTTNRVDPRFAQDAFTPSWVTVVAETAGPETPTSKGPAPSAFGQKHKLTAVMGSGSGGYAIVDGKCVRVGTQFDGMKLVSVANRSAYFESDNAKAELTVQIEGRTAVTASSTVASGGSASGETSPSESKD